MFVGRRDEVARLREAARGPDPVVVWGPAGAGKRALVRCAFPDGPPANVRTSRVAPGPGAVAIELGPLPEAAEWLQRVTDLDEATAARCVATVDRLPGGVAELARLIPLVGAEEAVRAVAPLLAARVLDDVQALDPPDRRLLEALVPMRDGVTLALAEAVVPEATDLVARLLGLRERSLLASLDGGRMRPWRAVVEAVGVTEEARARCTAALVGFGEATIERLERTGAGFEVLHAEEENLRLALGDACARGEVEAAEALASALARACLDPEALARDASAAMRAVGETPRLRLVRAASRVRRGELAGGIRDLEAALPRLAPPIRGRARLFLSRALFESGDLSGATAAAEGAIEDLASWPRTRLMARMGLASCRAEAGDLGAASETYAEAALAAAEAGDDQHERSALWGGAELALVRGDWDRAISLARRIGVPPAPELFASAAALLEGMAHLARGDRAQAVPLLEAGSRAPEPRLRARSLLALGAAGRAEALEALEGFAGVEGFDDLVAMGRALCAGERSGPAPASAIDRALLGYPEGGPPELHLARDGSWFDTGSGRLDLRRYGATRGILAALAEARLTGAEPLSADALVEAGWPDERILPEAAANRLYVTLARLRKLGLGSWLVRRAEGYLLDPDRPVTVR